MKRSRAMPTAVAASVVLAFVTVTSQASSLLSSNLDCHPIVVEAAQPAHAAQDDSTPVPEPASMALFGIGISSFITLRRFRKLFN